MSDKTQAVFLFCGCTGSRTSNATTPCPSRAYQTPTRLRRTRDGTVPDHVAPQYGAYRALPLLLFPTRKATPCPVISLPDTESATPCPVSSLSDTPTSTSGTTLCP
ncbi:hypothetical protein GQ600_9248 [Phytophthora cactorum]|nr:hypothetical protein GQ600_9248 [Phytophthora cactorum]